MTRPFISESLRNQQEESKQNSMPFVPLFMLEIISLSLNFEDVVSIFMTFRDDF